MLNRAGVVCRVQDAERVVNVGTLSFLSRVFSITPERDPGA
jgi:hypothetical protein